MEEETKDMLDIKVLYIYIKICLYKSFAKSTCIMPVQILISGGKRLHLAFITIKIEKKK